MNLTVGRVSELVLFMDNKDIIIDRILTRLKERSIDKLFLENAVYTHWPQYHNKPFAIAELVIDDKDKIRVFQFHKYRDTYEIVYLKDFDEAIVKEVESIVENSISHMKHYRVKFIGEICVMAATKSCASEYVIDYPIEVGKHMFNDLVAIEAEACD